MNEYRDLLLFIRILHDPMPTPPRPIRNEELFKTQFKCFLDGRIRRSFRACFPVLVEQNLLGNRAVISFDKGTLAKIIDKFVPDTAYFEPDLPETSRPNRAPGELKPSWKWSLELQHGNIKQRTEFLKVLAQVNHYMVQNQTRYGFVLTDAALVAIRRVNDLAEVDDAHLQLSKPIPWTAYGNEKEPQLTVLLGLWYLGMLASSNDN